MGTLGNDIFQDALSLDIKIRFEELLSDGKNIVSMKVLNHLS